MILASAGLDQLSFEGLRGQKVFLEIQDQTDREREKARRSAREASRMTGVDEDSLAGIVSGIGEHDRERGDLGETRAVHSLQALLDREDVSPKVRAQIGGILGEDNTYAGRLLGAYAQRSAGLRTSVKAARKNPGRMLTAITGENLPGLSGGDRRSLLGRGGGISSKLDTFLRRSARATIQQSRLAGGEVNDTEVNALANKMLMGTKAALQGKLGGGDFGDLDRQLNTTYAPMPPGSGKSGQASRKVGEFENELGRLTTAIKKARTDLKEK
jgi:hypothetical protein